MKHKKATLFLALAAVVLFPSYIFAQGNPPPPPDCCTENSAPTSPSITSGIPATESASSTLQATISDASLQAMGLTRSEYLNRLSTALFPDTTVYLVIPFVAVTTISASSAADADSAAIVSDQVFHLMIPLSQVSPDVIDTIDWLYLMDGQTYVEVIFIREAEVLSQ